MAFWGTIEEVVNSGFPEDAGVTEVVLKSQPADN